LKIQHSTEYRFHRPVTIWPHRLLLRPRESHYLRLISSNIVITPANTLTRAQDVFGNEAATASFIEMADHLFIDSFAEVELEAAAHPVFDIDALAISYPFPHSDDDWTDLGALTAQQYPDPPMRLHQWARSFVRGNPTDTLTLLKDINAGISASFCYQSREAEGTQSPVETLDLGLGSCRDFAVLFAEAVRVLGFGARIVSGYLYNPEQSQLGSSGAGSTHAWVEVYVPGAGWIAFDPTNGSVGGFNLVPVAVARNIHQAMPVVGSFAGRPEAFAEMSVKVIVST
jgi:transglutaminase-like putative cysteine protease